ncbi:homoserine kinase [Thioalkalivibrio thiocyanodenitrificans]|uniref:homoserine kinase n=1 Tax=Thioalkalivibrio thiocyanodenitrificans TaxID=243063 RepID=UPI000368FDAD|nr:homoserine kinase [Thioalkalivibrio thiocyanodenitrificans]
MSAAPPARRFPPPSGPPPTREELEQFLSNYALGRLQAFHPGRRGRRGRVITDAGQFWLVGPGMSDTFLEALLEHLAGHGLPVPTVVRDRDGRWIRPLGAYPGALVRWPEGRHLETFTPGDCARVGGLLGRVHLAGLDFVPSRPPHRSHQWRRQTAEALAPRLPTRERHLLNEEVRFQGLYRFGDLPQGIIHGAPNRRRLVAGPDGGVGLTGFGHACRHALLLDVAVAAHDCCAGPEGALDHGLVSALLKAYRRLRPLKAIERGAWPVLLRRAALDAWLEALTLGQDGAGARARVETRIREEARLQRCWVD